ncbi:MAG: phosphoribosylglycinamide formyltransferase 2 [Gaiellaceae bacterium]|nr:phosphoribosylglycinamide formyltransferase 2 [Gaiellaceae bacterium]
MTEQTDSRPVVMLLSSGSGHAGRDLALALERLGAVVHTVNEGADVVVLNSWIDEEKPAYVVADSAEISADVLIAAAEHDAVEVFPTPRAARLSLDREGLRRLAADELGLPTAPFWFAGSEAELAAVTQHAGFPLVVTPVVGAPTDGQSVLTRPDDVEPAWHRAIAAGQAPHRVMAETAVEVDDEVTMLTVRTVGPSGPTVQFCEPIGHRQTDGEPFQTWQPHQMSPAALDAARSIAARIVNSLGGRGVFGVELLVRGDEVYFSSVHPRPDDVGLVTLRSQRLSQFDLHARAILGLSIDTIMISPAAAEVLHAESGTGVLKDALAVPESDVRLLDGVTVALATAPDVVRARDRAHQVSAALRKPGS